LTVPGLGVPANRNHISWHLYTLQIDFSGIRKTRTQVMTELREQGIGCQVLYIPVHLQPWYMKTYGYARGKCPIAETFYAKALSLPLYPALADEDVWRVIKAVRSLA
jgi:dTDP-4-amino-4,6-dideoxygalactose transaminase